MSSVVVLFTGSVMTIDKHEKFMHKPHLERFLIFFCFFCYFLSIFLSKYIRRKEVMLVIVNRLYNCFSELLVSYQMPPNVAEQGMPCREIYKDQGKIAAEQKYHGEEN